MRQDNLNLIIIEFIPILSTYIKSWYKIHSSYEKQEHCKELCNKKDNLIIILIPIPYICISKVSNKVRSSNEKC